MNKQAITFLSLFTLILVLSIYYIMLPSNKSETVTNTISNTIEQMQIELNKKRDEIISQNNKIIAEETSTSEIITEALETISQTKDLKDKESELLEMIKELGFENVYVEIDNKTVKVTIMKESATQSDANSVIKAVLNKLGNDYQVEVKFVNE